MARVAPWARPLERPFAALVFVFATWKALLLLVAFASPGPGYDTSTTLLLGRDAAASVLGAAEVPWAASRRERLVSKLVRWDAIYFTAAAERGYQHEQEWAFSWAFSHLMAAAAKVLPLADERLAALAWAGVIISNASHLLSVLVLYRLAALLLPGQNLRKTAFLTAVLHVLSPAGLFLAAPYGEALFSLLNFSGMLCYAYTRVQPDGQPSLATHYLCILASGLCFGLATMVRSNGLLSGLVLVYDVVRSLPGLIGPKSEVATTVMRLIGTVLAGCVVAGGSLLPQWVAYQQYCTLEQTRPWCTKLAPSIYTWVQDHYWNVGFLRYWTLSNIPLFLLAAPTVWVLVGSSLRVIRGFSARSELRSTEQVTLRTETPHLLVAFGIPQLALALLAATNFHIQIVNRISSGYPIWYLTIAAGMSHVSDPLGIAFASKDTCNSIARVMVIYAMVQGALFASFLPPA